MPRVLLPWSFAMLFLLAACGSTDGNTWLIRTNTEEISVSEVGTAWINLDNETRMRFMSGDNPVGDFITALGRKTMVTMEIDNSEYLYSPVIQTMRKSWAMNSAFLAYSDSLSAVARRNITEEDLSNYAELLGSTVWYTSSIGSQRGPDRLPDLPWDVAFAFNSMAAGSTVEIEGVLYTLDSIITAPREMIDETIANTDQFRAFAINSLTESRVDRSLETLKQEALETFVIDSAAVFTYCTLRDSLDNSSEVASWSGGSISAEDLDGIIAFLSLGQSESSQSPVWVSHNLRNHARLLYIAHKYAEEFPDEYSVIEDNSKSFAMDQASDLLFDTRVSDTIVISDSMVSEAYNSLDSVPVLPESRTFESVMVPGAVLDDAMPLMNSDAELMQLGYTGYTEFLSDGSEFLSRPVFLSELPREMDLVLFLLENSDNSWQRPVEVSENSFVFYRLVETIPSHPASLKQLEPSLRRNLHIHLEEQKTVEWMCELEDTYNLQINSDILNDLPSDPSLWSEL